MLKFGTFVDWMNTWGVFSFFEISLFGLGPLGPVFL